MNYTSPSQVDALSLTMGDTKWRGLTVEQKTFCVFLASNDIESYMGVPRESGVRAYIGEYEIVDATGYQCLYLARTVDARLTAEQVREHTSGNYSSNSLSVTRKSEIIIDRLAKMLVEQFLMSVSNPKRMEFVRG